MSNSKLKGFLQLCRPANLPTAAADVLAGLALAGFFIQNGISLVSEGWLLLISSVFLYAGGVVLNDVFDFEIDKIERPERPIPSGLIPLQQARIFGFLLLIIGVGMAFFVKINSGLIALLLFFLILAYDSYSKKDSVLGPLNMGLCRGANLLLGMSIVDFENIKYTIIPIIYIAAITMVSQGEVHGKNKKNIVLAGVLYGVVISLLLFFNNGTAGAMTVIGYSFLLIFILAIGIPLFKAYQNNIPLNIKNAVKAGVISIILLDAVVAVHFSSLLIGLLIISLLPISIILSKVFAVT